MRRMFGVLFAFSMFRYVVSAIRLADEVVQAMGSWPVWGVCVGSVMLAFPVYALSPLCAIVLAAVVPAVEYYIEYYIENYIVAFHRGGGTNSTDVGLELHGWVRAAIAAVVTLRLIIIVNHYIFRAACAMFTVQNNNKNNSSSRSQQLAPVEQVGIKERDIAYLTDMIVDKLAIRLNGEFTSSLADRILDNMHADHADRFKVRRDYRSTRDAREAREAREARDVRDVRDYR